MRCECRYALLRRLSPLSRRYACDPCADPDHAEVRVALVGTKFEKHDVDLLTIREIGSYIANGSKAATANDMATR